MGIQETAQDTLHLVQALAEGKELEWRARHYAGGSWAPFTPEDGTLPLSIKDCEYRIKRDLREELFDLVKKYGLEMFRVGRAHEAECRNEEKELRKNAEDIGGRIELLVDMMLRGEK